MTGRESFIQTWAMETAATQRVLDAVPDKNLGYKPDPKSRSAIELAAWVAGHSQVILALLEKGEIGGAPMDAPKSLKDATGMFAAALPALEKKLKGTDNKVWETKTAKLLAPDGKVVQSGPLGSMVWFILFDLIHHRGQLSTYLRAMGGKVPSIYGPSADYPGGM